MTYNSEYYSKYHEPVDLCNEGEVCFLWDTNWYFKYNLEKVKLQTAKL
jgi:hypothetical protein